MLDIDNSQFGERLRNAIKLANTTQKDLADRIGVSKTAINNYVSGRIPDAIILYKISQCLDTTMEWLLAGDEIKQSNEPIDKEENELISLYSKCADGEKQDIIKNIKDYLLNPDYTFKKSTESLSDDELKILKLFRQLNSTDKIKIEGIVESKLSELKEVKKGRSSIYGNGEEAATNEKKHA